MNKDMLDDFAFHLKKDLDTMQAEARQTGPCFTAHDVKRLIDQVHFRVLSEERRRRKKGVSYSEPSGSISGVKPNAGI